jgi:hypothetical protein
MRDEETGGCIRRQVAETLWVLSGQYDVGVGYEYRRVGTWLYSLTSSAA